MKGGRYWMTAIRNWFILVNASWAGLLTVFIGNDSINHITRSISSSIISTIIFLKRKLLDIFPIFEEEIKFTCDLYIWLKQLIIRLFILNLIVLNFSYKFS